METQHAMVVTHSIAVDHGMKQQVHVNFLVRQVWTKIVQKVPSVLDTLPALKQIPTTVVLTFTMPLQVV